jgi:hypothetical protein
MIGAIPNPTKKVVIDFSIDQVKTGIKKISQVYKKYKLEKENPMFNQYTFEASEFLSLGVYIDINLTQISETRTEINIEVRRKLGAFDTWVEVQNANEHLQKLIDGLSTVLTTPDGQIKEKKETPTWVTVLGIIVALTILSGMLGK